jgi:hypothetical protein
MADDNVTQFPVRDLIKEMTGPERIGNDVLLDGRLIPNLKMFDRGDHIDFVLDERLMFGFPREQAWNAAYFAACAMAIGAGFPHFDGGKHFTQRDFAVKCTMLGGDDSAVTP